MTDLIWPETYKKDPADLVKIDALIDEITVIDHERGNPLFRVKRILMETVAGKIIAKEIGPLPSIPANNLYDVVLQRIEAKIVSGDLKQVDFRALDKSVRVIIRANTTVTV